MSERRGERGRVGGSERVRGGGNGTTSQVTLPIGSEALPALMEVLQVQVTHSSGRCENLPESSEGM